MTVLRPFFKHYGSKWRLSGKMPAPKHATIIEPFAGSAGYSLRYGAGKTVFLNDADPRVVAIWRWLLAATPEDVLALPVNFGRTDIRELGLEEGPMRLIQMWLSLAGIPSHYKMAPAALRAMEDYPTQIKAWGLNVQRRIINQLDAIKHWRITSSDYLELPSIPATWVIDPPYITKARHVARYGADVTDYVELGAWCRRRPGQVMVNEQYGAEWLPFKTLATDATTACQRGAKRNHEVIWTNESEIGE